MYFMGRVINELFTFVQSVTHWTPSNPLHTYVTHWTVIQTSHGLDVQTVTGIGQLSRPVTDWTSNP